MDPNFGISPCTRTPFSHFTLPLTCHFSILSFNSIFSWPFCDPNLSPPARTYFSTYSFPHSNETTMLVTSWSTFLSLNPPLNLTRFPDLAYIAFTSPTPPSSSLYPWSLYFYYYEPHILHLPIFRRFSLLGQTGRRWLSTISVTSDKAIRCNSHAISVLWFIHCNSCLCSDCLCTEVNRAHAFAVKRNLLFTLNSFAQFPSSHHLILFHHLILTQIYSLYTYPGSLCIDSFSSHTSHPDISSLPSSICPISRTDTYAFQITHYHNTTP